MTGEQIPPCGVPASVGWKTFRSMYPAFSHLLSMALSIGIWAKSQSWLISSKQARISPSRTHCGDAFLANTVKHLLPPVTKCTKTNGLKMYQGQFWANFRRGDSEKVS